MNNFSLLAYSVIGGEVKELEQMLAQKKKKKKILVQVRLHELGEVSGGLFILKNC